MSVPEILELGTEFPASGRGQLQCPFAVTAHPGMRAEHVRAVISHHMPFRRRLKGLHRRVPNPGLYDLTPPLMFNEVVIQINDPVRWQAPRPLVTQRRFCQDSTSLGQFLLLGFISPEIGQPFMCNLLISRNCLLEACSVASSSYSGVNCRVRATPGFFR